MQCHMMLVLNICHVITINITCVLDDSLKLATLLAQPIAIKLRTETVSQVTYQCHPEPNSSNHVIEICVHLHCNGYSKRLVCKR